MSAKTRTKATADHYPRSTNKQTPFSIVYSKHGHTRGMSVGAPGGPAGRSKKRTKLAKIACLENFPQREQKSTGLSRESKERRFNHFPEARTNEILYYTERESKDYLLTCSLSVLYARFISGMRGVFCLRCYRKVEGGLFFDKPFSLKACRGIKRLKNKTKF